MLLKQSNVVKLHHSSTAEIAQESPTDEVLIEEARLHVAIIQMVGVVQMICF